LIAYVSKTICTISGGLSRKLLITCKYSSVLVTDAAASLLRCGDLLYFYQAVACAQDRINEFSSVLFMVLRAYRLAAGFLGETRTVRTVPGQNGDNPKRRQDNGNITKTATEKYGQNGDK